MLFYTLLVLVHGMGDNWISEFIIPQGIPEELSIWANIIEKTANELCNDPDCRRIKFRIDMTCKVEMSATDFDALECFIQSFKKHENMIPALTRKDIRNAVGTCVVKSANLLRN
jgi:hypothetical protein